MGRSALETTLSFPTVCLHVALIFMMFLTSWAAFSRTATVGAKFHSKWTTRALASETSLATKEIYSTVLQTPMCSTASVVVVQCPTKDQMQLLGSQVLTENDDQLLMEELAYRKKKHGSNLGRLNVFLGGRIALRRSLLKLLQHKDCVHSTFQQERFLNSSSVCVGPIFSTPLGAPNLPAELRGSVSHKDELAIGAAILPSPCNLLEYVGVDLERKVNKVSDKLQKRLLTENEQAALGNLNRVENSSAVSVPPSEEVMLVFSFKEAIYKALNPFVRRSISFMEVEIFPKSDGTAVLNFLMNPSVIPVCIDTESDPMGAKFSSEQEPSETVLVSQDRIRYRAEWRSMGEYWLSCVHLWVEK